MKWILRLVAALVLLVLLGAGFIWWRSSRLLARRLAVTPEAVTVPTDSATLAWGAHLAGPIGKCSDCHGADFGGQVMDMGPMGQLAAANLTAGTGGIAGWSDADLVRAIRHGVRPDSSLLVFMPSMLAMHLTEPDLAALIAYLRALPPVDHELPSTRLGPIGRMVTVLHPGRMIPALGIDHAAPFPAPVPAGPTTAYGAYLTGIGGCVYCHRDNLTGGLKEGPPGTPPSANLTPSGPTASWTEKQFVTALRTGVRPDGTTINPAMPWVTTGKMTDDELRAIWLYLRSL